MLRKSLRAMGIALLLSSPVLPDIINVTVNSSVSGSGLLQVTCGIATPGCVGGILGVSYSFASGGFGDGQAVLPPPFRGSAFGEAFVVVTPTDQTLSIQLESLHFTQGFFRAFFASASTDVSVDFDLTEESILALGTSVFKGSRSGQLLDGQGNIVLPDLFNSPSSTLLAPGMYQFDLSAEGSSTITFRSPPGFETDFEVGMLATFTPVVPEPRGTRMTLFLLAAIAGCAFFRRRRVT